MNLLCTTVGESSITLTDELRIWSRRHSIKEFRAALEAEYAGRVAAGTMARLVPVLNQ